MYMKHFEKIVKYIPNNTYHMPVLYKHSKGVLANNKLITVYCHCPYYLDECLVSKDINVYSVHLLLLLLL